MKKSIYLIAVVLFGLNCYGQKTDSSIVAFDTPDSSFVLTDGIPINRSLGLFNYSHILDTSTFEVRFPANKSSKPTLKVYDKTGTLIVESDKNGNIVNHCLTIQDLIDYQKQCYNDSTKLCEWAYWDGMKTEYSWLKEGVNCPFIECIGLTGNIKYAHKTPNFNEFINLMTKDKNEKK